MKIIRRSEFEIMNVVFFLCQAETEIEHLKETKLDLEQKLKNIQELQKKEKVYSAFLFEFYTIKA